METVGGRHGWQAVAELLARLKDFIGLSRMTHSVLDIAHPALGAVVVFGGAPRPFTIVFGLLAAFSGYTAVFAMNDLMDFKVDSEKLGGYAGRRECFDIDSVGLRHPIAQGCVAWRAALGWVIFWSVLLGSNVSIGASYEVLSLWSKRLIVLS